MFGKSADLYSKTTKSELADFEVEKREILLINAIFYLPVFGPRISQSATMCVTVHAYSRNGIPMNMNMNMELELEIKETIPYWRSNV